MEASNSFSERGLDPEHFQRCVDQTWDFYKKLSPDSEEDVPEVEPSFGGGVITNNPGYDLRMRKIHSRIQLIDRVVGLRSVTIPVANEAKQLARQWSSFTTEELLFEREILAEICVREELLGGAGQQG